MNMDIIFATSNEGKVREVQEICDALAPEFGIRLNVRPMPEKVDIDETGSTYAENALIKARYVWDRYGLNCIADDSGLEVKAMGGAPGIYTARYCRHDFDNGIDSLLAELSDLGAVAPEDRRASFVCCIALIIGGEHHFFEGHCPGRINDRRCGSGGFGYDPVFIADATPGKCMSELTDAQKNTVSHRGLAMERMYRWLAGNGYSQK